MKKYLFIWFFLSLVLYASDALIPPKKAPLSIALPLLKSIDEHAIILGEGKIHMYVFIDPKCPRSQEFLEMVSANPNIKTTYQYHFFFYEIKRLHSRSVMASIYDSSDALAMMKQYMIEKKEIPMCEGEREVVTRRIEDISKVAKELHINKRPYLFIVKEKDNVL